MPKNASKSEKIKSAMLEFQTAIQFLRKRWEIVNKKINEYNSALKSLELFIGWYDTQTQHREGNKEEEVDECKIAKLNDFLLLFCLRWLNKRNLWRAKVKASETVLELIEYGLQLQNDSYELRRIGSNLDSFYENADGFYYDQLKHDECVKERTNKRYLPSTSPWTAFKERVRVDVLKCTPFAEFVLVELRKAEGDEFLAVDLPVIKQEEEKDDDFVEEEKKEREKEERKKEGKKPNLEKMCHAFLCSKRALKGKGRYCSIHSTEEGELYDEEFCFICLEGGQLVCCDEKYCPHVFHVNCLGSRAPKEAETKWSCPLHLFALGSKEQVFQANLISIMENCAENVPGASIVSGVDDEDQTRFVSFYSSFSLC